MATIRQDRDPAMRVFGSRLVQRGYLLQRSSGVRYAKDWSAIRRSEQNLPSGAPSAVHVLASIQGGNGLDVSPVPAHFLEFPLRVKGNPVSVRRPEWMERVFRAGQWHAFF